MEVEPLPLVVYGSEHPTLDEGALSDFMKLSNADMVNLFIVLGSKVLGQGLADDD